MPKSYPSSLDPAIKLLLEEVSARELVERNIALECGMGINTFQNLKDGFAPSMAKLRKLLECIYYDLELIPYSSHNKFEPVARFRKGKRKIIAKYADPFIAFIFEELDKRNLSIDQAFKDVGLAPTNISFWKKGVCPDVYKVRAMLNYLGYDIKPVPRKGFTSALD